MTSGSASVENAIRLVRPDGATPIAIMDQAYDAVVTEQLLDDNGGEETLSFSLPICDPKAALLKNEMSLRATQVTHDPADAPFQVNAYDAVHIIRTITEGYDDQGGRIFNIYAEALWYDLTTDDLITVTPAVNTAAAAMAAILAGTSWTVGVVSVPAAAGDVAWGSADLITPLAALRSLPAIFGGELVFDTVNRQVSLIPRRGDQAPHLLYVREGNMSHDTKSVSTTTLTTRVHPLGANSIDISSVNGGVPYIEDYTYYDTLGLPRSVKAQPITNDQISDPAALLVWARNQLDIMAKPTVTYDIGISLLAGKAIPHLGDLVRVTDPSLGLDTYARVSRRELNLVQPWLTNLIVDTAAYTLATPAGGGTGLPAGSPGTDLTIPNPPTNLVLTFGSGLDPNGNWNTYGVATWTAPTANSDGTPISDFDHYDLELLIPSVSGSWARIGSTSDTSAGIGYLPSNAPIQVRVRAVDHSYNHSAWVVAGVTVPLPTPFYRPPATPTLDADTLPLCIQVVWNGLDDNNVPYPQDVDTIEVHLVQGGTSFTPTAGTLHSAVPAQLGGFIEPLTGLTPGVPYTIELVAVGRLDTRSKPSVAVTATVLPVGPTHLVYNGDQDNIIADGSFETLGGHATLMADDSWSSAWSFITAATAPGGRGASAIAHGAYALMASGGTLTGQTRSLVLARSSAVVGQKFWIKVKYWNASTGGTCSLNVHSLDAAGNVVDVAGVTLPANGGYQTSAFDYTFPAGASTFEIYVTMNETSSAGYLFIDAAEARSVIQTAIIDSLAVTDAQIASASISKLIAGSLVADMTVSARIKTADSGARVEINSTGVFAFTSTGQNTVAIRNDGSASFTGTITGSTIIGGLIETASSGARVVLDTNVAAQVSVYSGNAYEGVPGRVVGQSPDTFSAMLTLASPQSNYNGGLGDPAYIQLVSGLSGISGPVVNVTAPGGIGLNYYGSGSGPVYVGASLQVGTTLTFADGVPATGSIDASATRVVSGTYYNSTDSNGYLNVPHGMSADGHSRTPASVVCTGQAPVGGVTNIPAQIMADTYGSSTFRIRVFDQTGTPYAGKFVTLSWIAAL